MLLKDGVRCHPKVLTAGAEAAWFWACCIDYSRQQLTDGFVPDAALPTLAACRSKVGDLVARLVAVGLLHREAGGVRVHDYLDHNDSAEKVKADKAKDAARKRGGMSPESVGTPDGIQTETDRSLARARGVGVGVGDLALNGRGAGEGQPAILAGQRAHRQHVVCGRVCLPVFVYDDLVRLKGGADADARAYVEAWAVRTLTEIPEAQTISEDAPKWWRGMWARDHPPSLPAPTKAKVAPFDAARAWAEKGASA